MSRDDSDFGLWEEIEDTMSNANAIPGYDGSGNFKRRLVIETCVVGPQYRGDPKASLAFEAKIPRSVGEALTVSWEAASRKEAAAFLRKLADLIEKR